VSILLPENGAALPARRADVPSGPTAIQRNAGSLPVLAAFQAFLENERQRNRRRMRRLMLLYGALSAMLVLAGWAAGWGLMKRFRTSLEEVHGEVTTFKAEARRARQETLSALSSFGQEAQRISRGLVLGTQEVMAVRSRLEEQRTAGEREMSELRRTLKSLESENLSLASRLDQIQSHWPAISNEVARVRQALAGVRAPVETPSVRPVRGGEPLALSILPPGTDRAVEWRIPIPE